MLAYATVADVGQWGPFNVHVDPHNYATNSTVDLEFRRLIWGLLSNLLGKDPENSRLIIESPFMQVLLLYVQRCVCASSGGVWRRHPFFL